LALKLRPQQSEDSFPEDLPSPPPTPTGSLTHPLLDQSGVQIIERILVGGTKTVKRWMCLKIVLTILAIVLGIAGVVLLKSENRSLATP